MRKPASTPAECSVEGHSYAVHLDLRDRPVLVVGAGVVAARKIERLVPTGAAVTVVAPNAIPQVAERDDVQWHRRRYEPGEVADYRLAFTCTGEPEIDAQVFADGEASGVWVNSADDIDNCSFILSAVARRGPVSVAVSTEGASPALASWLRGRFQHELDDGVAELVRLLSVARAELRAAKGSTEHPGWREALDDGLLEAVRAGNSAWAQQRLRAALGLDAPAVSARTATAHADATADTSTAAIGGPSATSADQTQAAVLR